eukprot:GEZU01019942.1.p1 GENE.GEZU01019942.1~~GEZU01019942.1.p1  ORF type:complete len:344 (-),score=104.12 GEZU01019942.1:895-1926(-)
MAPWTKVAFVVTEQHIPFDIPVQNCPTADNVKVKIDTLIVFRIARAEDFVFNLGPHKLNDILVSFVEEAIRSLARTVTYDEVYELRGVETTDMVRSLNDKLKTFGVEVSQVKVTNVQLPPSLADSMQMETAYTSKQREHRRNHEFQTTLLNDNEFLKLKENERLHERQMAAEMALCERLYIAKDTAELDALTERRLKEIEAEQRAEEERILAQAQLEEAKLIGEKEANLEVAIALAKKEAAIIAAEEKAYILTKKAATAKNVAENKAAALLTIATAEEAAATKLKEKRALEIEKRKLDVLKALVSNPNTIIAGSNDYDSLAQIVGVSDHYHSSLSLLPDISRS